ncbi:unnamed protein product [Gordionus sp. m RMFG-2023]|uniref:uncharacterized protein LOC135930213 n=1 Tax=Gordionus sp. m RMFG-2023 TaxID=3053472 RepID=UPI0030DEBE2D
MSHRDKKRIWSKAAQPLEFINLDLFDFENKIYILVVDAYSKWVECEEVRGTIQVVVKTWFGVAKLIVSDGGPDFISGQFKLFCSETGTRHILVPPYNPSSKGQPERLVSIVKNGYKNQSMEE